MPAAFDACVRSGGKVRTKKLPKNRYVRFCFIEGKTYQGKVQKKKTK